MTRLAGERETMATVSYRDLGDAFDFGSVDGMIDAHADIAKDTGKIYWVSDDKTSVRNYRKQKACRRSGIPSRRRPSSWH